MEISDKEDLIEGCLKSFWQSGDKRLSPDKIANMMRIYRGENITTEAIPDFFLSRNEVAEILGKNSKTVDYYCQKGILNRVYRPNSTKCLGITAKSLEELSGFATANIWAIVQAIRKEK